MEKKYTFFDKVNGFCPPCSESKTRFLEETGFLGRRLSIETATLDFIYYPIVIMVQTILLYLTVIAYLVMAYCFFSEWLDFFLADEEMDSEQRFFSSVILVIATILWPIVVPFAYLELLKFHKKHKATISLLIKSSTSKVQDDLQVKSKK